MAKASIMIVLFYLMHYSGRDLLQYYGVVSAPWATFVSYAVLFVIGVLLYGKHLTSEWKRFRKRRKNFFNFLLEILLWTLLAIGLTVATYFTVSGIFSFSILPSSQGTIGHLMRNLTTVPALLLIAISAPFVLELTFRESIIGIRERSHKFRLWLSSAIAIIAFVLIQTNRPQEMLFYLPLAILLTIFYHRYDRNAWASVFFHSLFNLVAYLLIRFVPAVGKFF